MHNDFEAKGEWVPKWNAEYFNASVDESTKLEDDPRYRELLEEQSLEWLQANETEWFERNYSGVAESGYLLDAQGRETDFLPSQCVTRGIDEVRRAAKETFSERFPEDAAWYKIDFSGKKAA